MKTRDMGARMRVGFIVFGVLMAVEVIEYVVGVGLSRGALPYLVALAVIGSWPIVQYFMHIGQLWHKDEE